VTISCGSCGTEFDPDRETRGDAERCPSCGATADADSVDAAAGLDDDAIACDLCGQPLEGMDAATDHMEDAHSLVTNAILSNTRGLGGETA
jgi:transcription elongation factor Elf1